MIKEALKYIVGMGKAEIHTIGEQAYSDKPLHLIEGETADAMTVQTLSSLVDYLKSEFSNEDTRDNNILVHVLSPTHVIAQSALNSNKERNEYIQAVAPIPQFYFDNWYGTEEFNIKLQSCFVKNDDRDVMLKVVGNIQEDNVKNVSDDGISQAVVAKVGVASVGNVEVPNPVSLAPYRTFVEVDQPESDFIFRMKNGPQCALFEADGGKWKLEAINNIKTYLVLSLEKEIENGKVTIIG